MGLTAYNNERLSLTTGTVLTLDSTLLSTAGASPASRAVIEVADGSNGEILYRFGEDPVGGATPEGHRLNNGEDVTVDGYDNLISMRFLLVGSSSPSSVYVTYYR